MKWDPEVGQLGWREIWVWLHNENKPYPPYLANAELFVISSYRKTSAGLHCNTLLEYRHGYDFVDPCSFGSDFIDCISTTEEKITSTRTVKRRLANDDDISWLFQLWEKKSNICYGRWLNLVRKEFVEHELVCVSEYKRLQRLIEPFLPTHPRNRYQED